MTEVESVNVEGYVIEGDIKDDTILARYHFNPATSRKAYYLRLEGGRMVDPLNRDIRRNKLEQAQWKRVPQNVYNLYLQFLRTHHKSFLYKAEREYNE